MSDPRSGPVTIIQGDARHLPLEDNSIDLAITSPPYYDQREYADAGTVYDGQIGHEPTLTGYIDSLLEATREMARVVKPTGLIWVNLGDKYAHPHHTASSGIPTKSLMAAPARYAIRCIDELGLTLRAEIIWRKTNPIPSSTTDRPWRTHETWFGFSQQGRHFANTPALQEGFGPDTLHAEGFDVTVPGSGPSPAGSVWDVPTEPLIVPSWVNVKHPASFPLAWPKNLIRFFCPEGTCTRCNEGVAAGQCGCNEPIRSPNKPASTGQAEDPTRKVGRAGLGRPRRDGHGTRTITRWEQAHDAATLRTSEHRDQMRDEAGADAFTHYARTDRAGARAIPAGLRQVWAGRGWLPPAPPYEPAPTVPSVVLDPFAGSGTTGLVASVMGRHSVLVEKSADYCALARWRTSDEGELAKAAGRRRPPAQVAGQQHLFDIA